MGWQKRARAGAAVFIAAFAAVVYFSFGERQAAAPAPPVERKDPAASSEIESGTLTAISGVEEDYKIEAKSTLMYPNGSSSRTGVRIGVRKRNGRDFVITADKATAGPDEKNLELSGNVGLAASDGFSLHTADATYNRDDGIARAPGAVTFGRGRMSGSGVGMTYDQRIDVLTITEQSKVTMTDEAGAAAMAFEAGTSTLNRMDNTLSMAEGVHVVRGNEQFDADRAMARLSEQEEFVTYIELRGQARVAGGMALDSMRARDIDLDYTDDGVTLERIILAGDAAVALAAPSGGRGREMFGSRLDLALAPDGTMTRAVGNDGVKLTFPAGDDAPARAITARTLDGSGASGKGLTSVRFSEDVTYAESSAGVTSREAHAQELTVALDGEAVSDAVFTGRVTFREQTLQARGADVRYSPAKGTIDLSGYEQGAVPHVEDEQITIDAAIIAVTFDSRRMTARGDVKTPDVKTTLRGSAEPAGSAGRVPGQAARPRASKMPGLLKADQAVTISAASLDYGGSGGQAIYTGRAVLRQGAETSIRAARIAIDQEAGNLAATGGARSQFTDESGVSEGTAEEIRYIDARRVIIYTTPAPLPARVKGPQGDVRASTIEIALEPTGSAAASLDARTLVSIDVGQRTITGDHLHYDRVKDVYVVQGRPGRLVTVVTRPPGGPCFQTTGMKLTLSKSTDNISIEGEERVRPKTGGGCTASPLPAPAPSR
jgi:LPS export ABC transporter protein LptC